MQCGVVYMPVFENITFSGGLKFSIPVLAYVIQKDWSNLSDSSTYEIVYDSISTKHFIPSTTGIMYSSTDGASTWNRESKGVLTNNVRVGTQVGIKSFAYNGSNRFVSIFQGNAGATSLRGVFYSNNGTDWTVSTDSTANTANSKTIWSGSNFVTKSTANTFIYSANGISWVTAGSSELPTSFNFDIATNGSNTVVITQATNANYFRSTNGGTSFTSYTYPSTGGQQGNIFHVANTFVVPRSPNVLIYSTDGLNWTRTGNIFPTSDVTIRDAASNGTIVVAVQTGGNIITSPANAFPNIPNTAWTSRTSGTARELYGVIWDGSRFVVNGENGIILNSTDGINWTISKQAELLANTRMPTGNDSVNSIIGNGNILIMGVSQGNGPRQFWTSSDAGINWTFSNVSGNQSISDLTFDGTNYLGLGFNRSLYKSNNGITWSQSNITSNTTFSFGSIAYGNTATNKYLATAFTVSNSNSVIFTSTDSNSWTQGPTVNIWSNDSELIYANSQYVLLGTVFGSLLVSSSAEGTTWSSPTTIASVTSGAERGIAFNGSTFVVVSEANIGTGNGRVFTSTDLTSWTERNSGITGNLNAISFNTSLSQFVVVGQGGRIALSSDGISWTDISSNATAATFLHTNGNYIVSPSTILRLIYQ